MVNCKEKEEYNPDIAMNRLRQAEDLPTTIV